MNSLNRYQDYTQETNIDAYKYEKRCYEQEERYRESIRQELERDYFDKEVVLPKQTYKEYVSI